MPPTGTIKKPQPAGADAPVLGNPGPVNGLTTAERRQETRRRNQAAQVQADRALIEETGM